MRDVHRSRLVKPAVAAVVTVVVGFLWHYARGQGGMNVSSLFAIVVPGAGVALAVWMLGRRGRPPGG